MESNFAKHRLSNIITIKNIVSLHYFEFEPDFSSKGERHNFWEIIYADKGNFKIEADDTAFTLKQGECYFHRPNEYHRHSADGKVAPNIFIANFVCNSQAMRLFKSKKFNIPNALKPIISSIIDEGKKTFDLPFNRPELNPLILRTDSIVGGQQMIRTYLEQLLILLIRNEYKTTEGRVLQNKEGMAQQLAAKMKEQLDGVAYKDISVSQFCEDMQYSKTYLSKIFYNNYGCTINQYISKVKINEAKKLIREHSHNFSQISDILCFSNPFYFSRVFKQFTGMSPSEYKKSVKID